MADGVQFQPQNPYALFDPTQWSNQFSRYNNQALPWPSSYAGMPTDAMGNPIQPPQGTTLNSSPAQPAPAPAPSAQSSMSYQPIQPGTPWTPQTLAQLANNRQVQQSQTPQPVYGQVGRSTGVVGYLPAQPVQPQQPQQAAPQAAAPQSGPGYSQILSMLANPGKVTTPGATVPASASSAQPGSANLQSFLANWRPASSGPGAGFQQNFATALKGMGY